MKINIEARHKKRFPEIDYEWMKELFNDQTAYMLQANGRSWYPIEYLQEIMQEAESSEKMSVESDITHSDGGITHILIALNLSGVRIPISNVSVYNLSSFTQFLPVVNRIEEKCIELDGALRTHYLKLLRNEL